MNGKTPQDLLREASDLIRNALNQLDVTETACSKCHGRHFNNFMHAKVHQRLNGTPGKLIESAIFLDAKDEGEAEAAVAHQRAEAARIEADATTRKNVLTRHQLRSRR